MDVQKAEQIVDKITANKCTDNQQLLKEQLPIRAILCLSISKRIHADQYMLTGKFYKSLIVPVTCLLCNSQRPVTVSR